MHCILSRCWLNILSWCTLSNLSRRWLSAFLRFVDWASRPAVYLALCLDVDWAFLLGVDATFFPGVDWTSRLVVLARCCLSILSRCLFHILSRCVMSTLYRCYLALFRGVDEAFCRAGRESWSRKGFDWAFCLASASTFIYICIENIAKNPLPFPFPLRERVLTEHSV